MIVVETYWIAVLMCIVTMLCWGSWANTQKLASKEWPFQLFYWDYCIGVLVLTVLFALTLGSMGPTGRTFFEDLGQAGLKYLAFAFIGGVIFNVANILLVAAIDIAGMAVAFPIGIGLALVMGVANNYVAATIQEKPTGDPLLLFIGVAFIAAAIVVNAVAYRRIPATGKKTTGKGIALSIACGILMSFFYVFVAWSMEGETAEPGMLTPYTALVFFSLGLFLSSFIFNVLVMRYPFVGAPVRGRDYFEQGNPRLHLVGILGGAIWGVGMSFNIVASETATTPVAYGLGQGATMVAALWGVFIWREFKQAKEGTNALLLLMFVLFLIGLSLLVYAQI